MPKVSKNVPKKKSKMIAIIYFLLFIIFSTTTFGAEYEGLVLLKKYANMIETSKLCEESRLKLESQMNLPISNLPTDKSINIINYIIETNSSAIVFDFENPSLGLGNCLLGFIQSFHWSVLSGLPLFILKHEKGTANALCWFFDCGFPLIDVEELDRLGARRYIYESLVFSKLLNYKY